jgi:hypothetical protein
MANKLEELVKQAGYSSDLEFIDVIMRESTCLGICMNDGCDYTTDVEPDQTKGYCENCMSNSVKSGLELILF